MTGTTPAKARNLIRTKCGDYGIYSPQGAKPPLNVGNRALPILYPDGRTPTLAPAYDFLATIPYLPDDRAALKYSRTKRMSEVTKDELVHFAAKARLPERLVLKIARETVSRFKDVWAVEKGNLPLAKDVRDSVDAYLMNIPMFTDL